ncbi:dTDP-glucose 4,6-dehydratase [Pelagibacteraceae bacterium]|nr:dTDP-glucose 4,6-dehydratase [Pelagibacteraceae bacterium]MDC0365825.1 dTDP-glucose 4,6-dehydratase [Pelagibacteraceae bacterium]|tara:strand:- start:126 stop:1142 length:1017 start_codon:yes stop_codon:yes gene_type:complete
MKKVIVTGGNGFIGSNLINFLIQKNYFVINIDKSTYSKNSYILKNLSKRNYIFYKLDINNKKKILNILKKNKPNAIFNLAAETHVDRSIDSPKEFINSNICGVFNLLEAIREYKKKIRLIHISTDEVYGDLNGSSRSDEKSSYNPSSPYSASKASSDHLIQSYVRTFGVDASISNCCNNYGPGQFPEKLIPTLIFNILNNKPLPIYGKGINSREWIYVEDHCRGLLAILKKGKKGESYNIGTGLNINNLNLTKLLLNIVKNNKIKIGKKVKIKFVKDRPGHDLRYALNSNKIKKQLKWKPLVNFKSGLKETFIWYYENDKFFNNFSKRLFFKRLGLKK